MKALRTVLAVFLVIIIVGGVGYLGYTFLFMGGMSHGGMNMAPSQTMSPEAMQEMQGGQQQQQNAAVPNVLAAQNREKLSEASAMIDQAMALISIDPYSKATVPFQNGNAGMAQMQPGQSGGTINVYPSGNSSLTIMPGANNPVINPAPTATATPQTPAGNSPANNYVYDQTQLRQLHSDIYNVAQGIMMVKGLNDDLLVQSSTAETNPPNYQTYVVRYNTALQNKTKLNNAVAMLNSISTMVNVNPYAPQSGYEFKSGNMDNLHEGVYKLAQAMVILNSLNDDFTQQMTEASVGAQSAANSMNLMPNMNMDNTTPISLNTIFNIVIIILIIGLVAGIIGAIMRMVRHNNTSPADGIKSE